MNKAKIDFLQLTDVPQSYHTVKKNKLNSIPR